MLELTLSFAIGFICGAAALMALSFFLVKGDKKKVKKVTEPAVADSSDYEKARERLLAAAEIGARQLELLALAQEPSKNALHSKYKNEIIQEVRQVEEDKRTLLRSIIKDGLNPKVSVTGPNGEKVATKLSDYMNENGIPVEEPVANTPVGDLPEDAMRPTKGGKFFVIDGGKGKGTTH